MMRRVGITLIAFMVVGCATSGEETDGVDLPGTGSVIESLSLVSIPVLGPDPSEPVRAPLFRWGAVDGATTYRVVVADVGGVPIWAWEGEATEVWMGGHGVELPVGLASPVVGAGSTWTVVGVDAAGVPVALSARSSLNGTSEPITVTTERPDGTTTTMEDVETEAPDDIAEVCSTVDPDAVRAITGPGVAGYPSDLVVGGDLLGRSCGIAGGVVPAVTLGVYFGTADSWVGRCDICEEYDGLGDAAWGGIGEAPNGQTVGYLYAESGGLAFTVETQGVDVTLEQLDALIRSLISANS